jgi:ubiquinol-cytochrome c reductase cytochrome c1 subunit
MKPNLMKRIRKLLLLLAASPLLALASAEVQLDPAPINPSDKISLQRGARNFVNYCLNCHSAQYMRYGRLQDLGLTQEQIKDYLILTNAKIGDTMSVAMETGDAKKWLGVAPPDLSVEGRVRGADWLYTYLRTYYRDDSRPIGWNNLVFPNVGMPHALWQLQGIQVLKVTEKPGEHGKRDEAHKLEIEVPGTMSPQQYNEFVADLVNFLVYMAEPAKTSRTQLGIIVLFFTGLLYLLMLFLKKEYWKDIK